jgi:hypothetical protein
MYPFESELFLSLLLIWFAINTNVPPTNTT